MKAIYKSLIAAAIAAPALTGCIEEPIPTITVLAPQLVGNANAIQAFASAMGSTMTALDAFATTNKQHYAFAWPAMMHVRDVMTEDMVVDYAGGYDWFGIWSQNGVSLGPRYMVCQYPWNFYYAQILATNNSVKAVDPETDQASDRYYLGASLAFRAATYLDLARMYEVMPTAVNTGKSDEGNDIIGLTVPIVTDLTTEEDMRNNPRAPHAEMFAFIVDDLTRAVDYMAGYARPTKTLPDVATAKGLLARAYLWDASFQAEINADAAAATASYNKAAQYAREAINESGATPLTREEYLSTTSGFNTLDTNSWLWGGQYSEENTSNLINWISFCSNEQNFGYAAPDAGAYSAIGANVYNRISDDDWRKLAFVAPEGSALSGQEVFLNKEWAVENGYAEIPYLALKIRPGQGEMDDYKVAAVVGFPLLRVEELYFIEAEAHAHVNISQGRSDIENFMRTYRYSTYGAVTPTDDALIKEIVFQKRVELWGEGQSFFDFKRLNLDVTRWYKGTNFEVALNTFNTVGRPAWMNFCIVSQEVDNNVALVGYNTPAPNAFYKVITEEP